MYFLFPIEIFFCFGRDMYAPKHLNPHIKEKKRILRNQISFTLSPLYT